MLSGKKICGTEVLIMQKYDVVIVGGGFSGVAAALAAAREGARVLIVEKGNSLGGAAANCLVLPFMPYSTTVEGKRLDLSAGLFREIHRELEARGAMSGESFLEEELKQLLGTKVRAAGVSLLYHAYLLGVKTEDGAIKAITVATKSGEIGIEADCFIDATGDAQLAYLAGCPTTLGREPDHLCQPMTLCFRLGNVDVDRFFASKERFEAKYRELQAAGEIQNPREDILVFKTPVPNVLHFNTTRVVKKNPTDPFDVTEAELLARDQVFEVYDFLKKYADGVENSFLLSTAAEIGVRESRMIVGEYVLTERDCRDFCKFEDAIAACNYDIDIHNPEGSGTSHYYFPAGAYYTIPYRSLIPRGVSNMLVAGRCISSDHGAQASYRIMPTVCCIGEAAGLAAALAVKNGGNVRGVDVKTLQKGLLAHGAFLGI